VWFGRVESGPKSVGTWRVGLHMEWCHVIRWRETSRGCVERVGMFLEIAGPLWKGRKRSGHLREMDGTKSD